MQTRSFFHSFIVDLDALLPGGLKRFADSIVAKDDQRNVVNFGKFLSVATQLGLLVLVIREFQIADLVFYHHIMALTFIGFLVHHFLPVQYRLPFFLLLSLVGIWFVFGFPNAIWLVTIGLVLIGVCHLPLSLLWRVAILLSLGAGLAVLRTNLVSAPWPEEVWPILGSMFMFRLIIYLYDLKHQQGPANITFTLAYFFLLPNVVFPLFPVVDYATFRRTYYDKDRYRIYQTGIRWIFRGVIQLILYRYVNFYLVIAPGNVNTIGDLVRYLVSNFLLYLQVSGQFHLIVGILHLFGFSLPETNHRYLLSSSFTDFWRRINIYWKDFMMKVFYYPTYFRVRKKGTTAALVVATLVVFAVTWFLHAYQWFWLRGTFLLSTVDILFWTILATLVLANALYEARHGRQRTLGKRSWTFSSITGVALRTAGTFIVICVLWSLWTSTSLEEWFSLWSAAISAAGNVAAAGIR